MWPTNAWAKRTSRSVTFEDAIISPSSMKKGTASRGTALMPLNISATTVARLISVRSTPIMTLAMTAKGTGTPRTPNRTNKNAIRPTIVHSLTLRHPFLRVRSEEFLFIAREAVAPAVDEPLDGEQGDQQAGDGDGHGYDGQRRP